MPSIFRNAASSPLWDDIQGTWDEVAGTFDQGGDPPTSIFRVDGSGGSPSVFRDEE